MTDTAAPTFQVREQQCPHCAAVTLVLTHPPPRTIQCAACGWEWETDRPQQPRLFFEETKQ